MQLATWCFEGFSVETRKLSVRLMSSRRVSGGLWSGLLSGVMSMMWERREPTIETLLDEIAAGRLALPQFQRPPVWSPKRNEIPFLMAILLGRPTGSLLTLAYNEEPKQFPVHAVDGAPSTDTQRAKRLILDGQQRLTTLFRALRCGWQDETDLAPGDVDARGPIKVERMILNVREAAERGNLDEDDFSLEAGADGETVAMAATGRLDFRTLGVKEDLRSWVRAYIREFGGGDPDEEDRQSQKLGKAIPFLEAVLDYRFPDMELKQDTEIGVVAEIFEHMNSRGQPLNRFDLMVARMYTQQADGQFYDLRESWSGLLEQSHYLQRLGIDEDDGLMPLQLIAWYANRKVTTAAVLQLPPEVVLGDSSAHPGLSLQLAVSAFEDAAEFLATRCGVISGRLLPQKAMLLPIASQFLRAAVASSADTLAPDELKKWFFASCFTQPAPRYYGGVNSRVAEDCAALEQWIDHGRVPDYVDGCTAGTIKKLDFSQPMTRERNILGVAAMAILVHAGAKDWSPDQPQVRDADSIHLHHMVPEERLKEWWPGKGENRQKRLNIANFAPVSSKLNQRYGAKEPEKVLIELGSHASAVLGSHSADEAGLREAFKNEKKFEAFCRDRSDRLAERICVELGLQ